MFYITKVFTLLELVIVLTIIAILTSIFIPSLSKGRLNAKASVCKANLQQITVAEMLYAHENSQRVFATIYGSEWVTETKWRGNTFKNIPAGRFYDGNTAFLEPYLGNQNSIVFKCPATEYDKSSDVYRIDQGKSYEGFMERNLSTPEFIDDVYFKRKNERLFTDASRKPFFWDYTAPINSTSDGGNMKNLGKTTVHDNSGKLNLATTDGSVIVIKFPIAHWSLFNSNDWIPYFESALGESAN